MRLYSRNANDWTTQLRVIAHAAKADQGQELHDRRRGRCARASRLVSCSPPALLEAANTWRHTMTGLLSVAAGRDGGRSPITHSVWWLFNHLVGPGEQY